MMCGNRLTGQILLSFALLGLILIFFHQEKSGVWVWLLILSGTHYLILSLVFYSSRFFLPILPAIVALCLLFLDSVRHSIIGVSRFIGPILCGLALTVMFLVGFPRSWSDIMLQLKRDPVELRSFASRPEVATVKDQLIAARKPHFPYISGNRFAALPLMPDINHLAAWMRKENIKYLFLSRFGGIARPALRPLLIRPEEYPDFELVAHDASQKIGLWKLRE